MTWASRVYVAATLAMFAGCDEGRPPTAPSPPVSFLVGTWRGTVAIAVAGQAGSDAPIAWTFALLPQSNQQSFEATIQSEHPWLPSTLRGVADLAPSATPPTQIGTEGSYASPRGCRGIFGSLGVAETTRIEATFNGADCDDITFTGTVTLTKDLGR